MRTTVFAMLLVVTAGAALAAQSVVSPLFGTRVSDNTRFKAPYATADLDGDGKADAVYLVSVAKGSSASVIAPDVKVLPALFHSQPLGGHEEKLAIAILLANKQKFLITGYEGEGVADFFDSPSWNEKSIPLSVAKRGSQTFRSFEAQEKRIRHDILVIGTEAGIDMALYWDGKTLSLFEPVEEP